MYYTFKNFTLCVGKKTIKMLTVTILSVQLKATGDFISTQ